MNLKHLKLNLRFPEINLGRKGRQRDHTLPGHTYMHHINPRFRAYGKARLDIASRVASQEDWDSLWKPPAYPFALTFPWAATWKQCIEYHVTDFAAEIGFWIDIMGFQVTALGPDYAQFVSPGGAIALAVASVDPEEGGTPVNAFRIQFYIDSLQETCEELYKRSIQFEQEPQQVSPESSLSIASFRTPHGIAVDLWSECLDNRPDKQQAEHITPKDGYLPEALTENHNVNSQTSLHQVEAASIRNSFYAEEEIPQEKSNSSWQDFLTIPSEQDFLEQNAPEPTAPELVTSFKDSPQREILEDRWAKGNRMVDQTSSRSLESWQVESEQGQQPQEKNSDIEENDDYEEDDWEEDLLEEDDISDGISYENVEGEEESID